MTDFLTIESALIGHLKTDIEVAAIAADRIYPDFIPETRDGENIELPAIAVSVDGDTFEESLNPEIANTLVTAQFEVNCVSYHKPDNERLRRAVAQMLNNFNGPMGDFSQVVVDDLHVDRTIFIPANESRRIRYIASVAGDISYYEPAVRNNNLKTA